MVIQPNASCSTKVRAKRKGLVTQEDINIESHKKQDLEKDTTFFYLG